MMPSPNSHNDERTEHLKPQCLGSSGDKSDGSSQRLQLLQIQFDEMMQVSSHLLKERESLAAQNCELLEAVFILQDNEKVDTTLRARMKREIHDLKKQLQATQTELKEAHLGMNLMLNQAGDDSPNMNSTKSIKQISRKNFLHQYASQHMGSSFRIDGITSRNRYKNLQRLQDVKIKYSSECKSKSSSQKNEKHLMKEPEVENEKIQTNNDNSRSAKAA